MTTQPGAAPVQRRPAWWWARHRRRGLFGVLVALAMITAACAGNAGDPGNRRLKALKADPALKLVPPGATSSGQSSTGASKPPFTDYYNGPSVGVEHHLAPPYQEALDFYAKALPELGWKFWKLPPGDTSPDVGILYTKSFGDWEATLSVSTSHRDQVVRVVLRAPPATDKES